MRTVRVTAVALPGPPAVPVAPCAAPPSCPWACSGTPEAACAETAQIAAKPASAAMRKVIFHLQTIHLSGVVAVEACASRLPQDTPEGRQDLDRMALASAFPVPGSATSRRRNAIVQLEVRGGASAGV